MTMDTMRLAGQRGDRLEAPALDTILRILLVSSDKQMSGVAAWSVIAPVADDHLVWNRLIVLDFPSYAMRRNRSALHREPPISAFANTTAPRPALVRFASSDEFAETLDSF